MNSSRPIVMSYLNIFLQALNETRRHLSGQHESGRR